jgi:hypothetical protein
MCVALLITSGGAYAANVSRSKSSKDATTDIDVRVITQQGLAIALASNVLQSQVTVLFDATGGGSGCVPLSTGTGSSKILRRVVSGAVTGALISIYYDTACRHPYIEANAHVVSSNSSYVINEDAEYLATTGGPLGQLRVVEAAVSTASRVVVHGTGTFTPHDGAPVVHLGLTCAIPAGNVPPPFPCEGGIAQTFPQLGVSLGSVTPITLTLKAVGSDQYVVHFASTRSTMVRAAPGALSIGTTANSQLRVTGDGATFTTDATTGTAGRFALFPPTPTGWTITDQATQLIFSISVLNNASRQLNGSVTTTSGKELATLHVDRSGTGFITYGAGVTDPITGWMLSG